MAASSHHCVAAAVVPADLAASTAASSGLNGSTCPTRAKEAVDSKWHYEMVSYVDRLILERIENGDTFLTDKLCLKKQKLPPGRWELILDNDGWAALQKMGGDDDAEAEVLLVEDILLRTVWKRDDGSLWVVENGGKQWSLTQKLQEHEPAVVSFKVGVLRSVIQFPVWLLTWPRAGGRRYLWELPAFYHAMKLTSYSGKASKWTYAKFEKWDMQTASMLNGFHLFRSRLSMLVMKDEVEKFLPAPCCTTSGMLLVLLKWACATIPSGGLRQGRDSAECLLRGLLLAAVASQPLVLRVSLSGVVSEWPAAAAEPDIRFTCTQDGRVLLQELMNVDEALYNSIVSAWRDRLQSSKCLSETGHHMPLVEFLAVTCAWEDKALWPVHGAYFAWHCRTHGAGNAAIASERCCGGRRLGMLHR